ncbi:unnamed protein product [Calypogeia fissa]
MEESAGKRGERVAVKVELEAFPLKGAPIPPCRLQSIAITRGNEVGAFVLFIGTESGHVLRYSLSSPIVQDSSSFNSPSQTPPHQFVSTQSLPPIPPLSLPPSPAPLSVPVGESTSISIPLAVTQAPSAITAPSPFGTDPFSSPPVDSFLSSSPAAIASSSGGLPKFSVRDRNGIPSPQLPSHSPIRQSQHMPSPLSPHLRSSSAPLNGSLSSRGPRQQQSTQMSNSSSALISSLQTSMSRPGSSPSSPASRAIPTNATPSSFSLQTESGAPPDYDNGGAQTENFTNSPSTRPSSPLLPASAFTDPRMSGGKPGVEMVLTICKQVSKSPIETLCPLPECGRIAILSDGHVALLDLQSLNILDRLPGTKGAVTMARGLNSTLPTPYRSSFMVLEGLPEQGTRALVGRNDSMNKLFGRGRLSSKFGGLVGGLDKAFSPGRADLDGKRSGRQGRMGNLTGSARAQMDRTGGTSGLEAALTGKCLGRLAVAVKKKIILFEIRPSDAERSEDVDGLMMRDDSNRYYALKVREVTAIEGVITMAWLGDVIIAGTRHEYLLFSLTSGLPTHLYSQPQEVPWQPLLKAFPKNREALLLIDNAGIPINTEGDPAGGSLLFQILPDGIGYSPPYVLVAKQGVVEVYHHRTGSKMQSLVLADGAKGRCLVTDDDDGIFIIIANSFKVWCLRQLPLAEQLKELLKRKAFKDAERLAEEGQGESDGDTMKARLALVHAEAGFLHLFDLNFEEAVDHFLLSDIMEPAELFPFFPSLTTRWRAMVPRKRYWGLHPPPQSMKMVIESGLLAIQSGLLKSQVFVGDGSDTEDLFVGLKSGKDALVERYLTQAMENVARYLHIIRDKRELKVFEKEGVDTLLMKLYSELGASGELEELAASSNNCVLEEVESFLKGAGQLHALALLYESKGLWSLALQVWKTLAHTPDSPARYPNGGMRKHQVRRSSSEQAVAVTEAVRILEQSSDTDLVLQHISWIIGLDQNLALNVLTSSKRAARLSPEDTLLALESDRGVVQQRYLLWLVQEQGLEDSFYHTELALSLAKSAVRSLENINESLEDSQSSGVPLDSADQNARSNEHYLSTNDKIDWPTTSSTSGNLRDFLLTFLETSDYYDAKMVLDVIKESKLWKEQFVLHRKLGDEMSALRTLALKLEDSAAAEQYCAEIGQAGAYLELMEMYLDPGEGREPMHRAAVRLLHCHGTSLDPLQVLEALPLEMPLGSASETIAQLMVARVHRRRQGQIVRQLVRKDNLEARISRVEERSRHVSITAESTCGSCGARIGTKLFALYPDESVFCYKCLRRYGENARPVTHRKSDKGSPSSVVIT